MELGRTNSAEFLPRTVSFEELAKATRNQARPQTADLNGRLNGREVSYSSEDAKNFLLKCQADSLAATRKICDAVAKFLQPPSSPFAGYPYR